MTQWLMKSDVGAALAGALFKSAFPSFDGSMGNVALRSLVISIVARILSTSSALPLVGNLNSGQKNELFVAVMGALSGYYMHGHHSLQGGVAHVSIDLMGDALLSVLGMSDGELLAAARSAA